MKLFAYVDGGHGTGEILAPRFNPKGEIEEAIYCWVDQQGKAQFRTGDSFVPLDPNWRTKWTSGANIPHGANLFLDADTYPGVAENPMLASQEFADAIRHRQAIYDESIRIGGGGAEGGDQVSSEPSGTNAPADSIPTQPIPAAAPAPEFDPRDIDHSGDVSKKEQRKWDREHEK